MSYIKILPLKTSKLCWGISLCFKGVKSADNRQLLLRMVGVKQVRTPQDQAQSKCAATPPPLINFNEGIQEV